MPLVIAISFRPGSGSASTAASNPRECSPGSGSHCSVSGPGTNCRRCPPRSCCSRGGCRSISTTGAAGPARSVVPITVVASLRPVRPLPFTVAELRTGGLPAERRRAPARSVARAFQLLDAVLHRYERSRVKPGRSAVLHRAAEWIIARQEADGGWGGIQPPWVYSILALHLLGYPLDHPVLAAAIQGLEGFLVHERTPAGVVRRLEACQSPVWDTCLAVIALADAGVPADDPALRRAAEWLLREEIRVRGDWSVRRPDLPPGGWAFEFANDGYPDVDDTAEVVLALDRLESTAPARRCDRARRRVGGRHAVSRRWLGRLRRRQHPAAYRETAVLRFRRRHRSTVGRRDRARRRDARGPGPGAYRRGPGRRAVAPGCAGARRLVVRPMGRESHLRHRRRRSGTRRRRSRPGFAARETGRSLAARSAELRRRMG